MSWSIDSSHSVIQFKVRHMMISNVRGRFRQFNGNVEFDEAQPENTTVGVTIDAASITTEQEDRDNHLRSADFLNAAQYPNLRFQSKRVEALTDDKGRLVGDLTIRDVTREVVLDVEHAGTAKSPWGATSAGFTASTVIDRRDWGLTWNQALETGGILVGDAITIDIDLELIKEPEEEEAQQATN